MSDVARAWAAAQDSPTRNAHEVLKELAQWADAAGETWVKVDLLARACKCTERTAQRGLAALKGCGLIIDTGQKKTYSGRLFPIYQLPIETGPANLMQVIRAENPPPVEAPEAEENGLPGDSGVTRSEGLGVTVASPHGCQPCHPTGDSGVTQIGNGITQGLTPFAGERASEADRGLGLASDGPHLIEAMAAWARKAPERVAAARVRPAWATAKAASGWTGARLCAAVTACVTRDPDFGWGRALALDRWLAEERFRSWDQSDVGDAVTAAGSARATWSGPNRVREIVGAAMGASGVASYLDPAGWDETEQAVVAATGLGATRLREAAGRALGSEGFRIVSGSAPRG